ncbi:uncharacterized protein B0J16DRAFT_400595 [Fusarium flagelliforme]|uniref:uncharacterized protein n=1 Tax=Fusarium flagelliforme TaxID=2675880 RepID=UPI001E8DFC04|nr:uncharacterized protein B0J16DRAFT_400595 [Fusarium flagelliforme]KAH7182391.1 hypothetical protein B0J16DRAFT_400595 [Fusarium flagelliforme]
MAPHITTPAVEDYVTSVKPKSVNGSKLVNNSSTEYGAHITKDVVSFVRDHSPYYKSSLSHLPQDVSLAKIPLIDSDEFWKQAVAKDTNVPTGPFVDGLVMGSADSTSEPKTVYWTRDEFHRILSRKAEIMSKQSGIIPGDRIANLSHMGGMYGGFMFTNQALMEMPTDNVHLPISGQMPHDFTADSIDKFKATVMISTVYATTKLASWLKEQGRTLPSVRLILFMGEAFFKDVRDQWTKAFPNPPIGPYIYGSVDKDVWSFVDKSFVGFPFDYRGFETMALPHINVKLACPRLSQVEAFCSSRTSENSHPPTLEYLDSQASNPLSSFSVYDTCLDDTGNHRSVVRFSNSQSTLLDRDHYLSFFQGQTASWKKAVFTANTVLFGNYKSHLPELVQHDRREASEIFEANTSNNDKSLHTLPLSGPNPEHRH